MGLTAGISLHVHGAAGALRCSHTAWLGVQALYLLASGLTSKVGSRPGWCSHTSGRGGRAAGAAENERGPRWWLRESNLRPRVCGTQRLREFPPGPGEAFSVPGLAYITQERPQGLLGHSCAHAEHQLSLLARPGYILTSNTFPGGSSLTGPAVGSCMSSSWGPPLMQTTTELTCYKHCGEPQHRRPKQQRGGGLHRERARQRLPLRGRGSLSG